MIIHVCLLPCIPAHYCVQIHVVTYAHRCVQIHAEVEHTAASCILAPLEKSLTESDSKTSSGSAESAESASSSRRSQSSTGAEQGRGLLGSALLARVDELVQKCVSTKASIKEMQTRLVLIFRLA